MVRQPKSRRNLLKTIGLVGLTSGFANVSSAQYSEGQNSGTKEEDEQEEDDENEVPAGAKTEKRIIKENNSLYFEETSKGIRPKTKKHVTWSQEEKEQLERARRIVNLKHRIDMRNSIESVASSPSAQEIGGGPPKVTIGDNQTFSNTNVGDSGKSANGAAIDLSFSGSKAINSQDRATACIVVDGIGVGACDRWAYVGKKFQTDGSESRTADVKVPTKVKGWLSKGSLGINNKSEVTLEVWESEEDSWGGSYWSKSTTKAETYTGVWGGVDHKIRPSITVKFDPGKTYIALVKIRAKLDYAGFGEAGADFGPQDHDGHNQGATVDRIELEF